MHARTRFAATLMRGGQYATASGCTAGLAGWLALGILFYSRMRACVHWMHRLTLGVRVQYDVHLFYNGARIWHSHSACSTRPKP